MLKIYQMTPMLTVTANAKPQYPLVHLLGKHQNWTGQVREANPNFKSTRRHLLDVYAC